MPRAASRTYCRICAPIRAEYNGKINRSGPFKCRVDPIFDLLGQIDTDYWDGRTILSGQYLHLFLLGVAEQFTRRGVGRELVAACLENGAAKGYTSAVTEATNPISQHIFRELGFERQAERSYSDYQFGGSAVFASIAEHGGPMTMDRRIQDRVGDTG